jgi:hypothetical protein
VRFVNVTSFVLARGVPRIVMAVVAASIVWLMILYGPSHINGISFDGGLSATEP